MAHKLQRFSLFLDLTFDRLISLDLAIALWLLFGWPESARPARATG